MIGKSSNTELELNSPQEPNSLKSFAPRSTSLLPAEARLERSLPIHCSSIYVLIRFFFFFLKPLIILI